MVTLSTRLKIIYEYIVRSYMIAVYNYLPMWAILR